VKSYPITIKPFGNQAILVEWPANVEEAILEDILQFNLHLKTNYLDDGEWEFVPAYNSLALIHKEGQIDFKRLRRELQEWYGTRAEVKPTEHYLWKLPVCYDDEFAIDLLEVASVLGRTPEEIIAEHTAHIYTVYGIGFLPGFMYLGGLPEGLETPRKENPRLKVEKGAVGLAGKQTGIYPQESPGGWSIIGNCPIPIFNVKNENPCFAEVGDKIQFYQISKGKHNLHKIEGEVGIFKMEKIKLNA
jgi:KipI family sensor histidine kinase inhibitor